MCPRACGVDRSDAATGFCRTTHRIFVSSICAHRGEEPILSGDKGICNIFFAHCNLQCRYCQNHQISSNQTPLSGLERSLAGIGDEVAAILQRGINLVGFVTPSHCLIQMLSIMDEIERRGFRPRYVYNTNAYDRPEVIAELADRIDVYLPDLKYSDDALAWEYSGAKDYVEVATGAVKEMFRQKGADIALDNDGLITNGLIIRHLVLPGQVTNSKHILRFIACELSTDVHISLMSQYYPTPAVTDHPLLGRTLYQWEYDEVMEEFDRLGFHRGWVQELDSPSSYQPDFRKDHPFES
ncbi:MAG: radical SAM protein [bacterium]